MMGAQHRRDSRPQRWVLAVGSPRACPHSWGWQSCLLGSSWLPPPTLGDGGTGLAGHLIACHGRAQQQ